MEWRGGGRQDQARASGRLCCVLWHVGCVLPGSGRAVDRPTHQIGFRKLARQVPTNENQLSPVPVPVPVPQVPSPKPKHREPQPARTHPIQFTWAHCAAFHRFLRSPSLCLSVHPESSLCLRLRLPPSIDLRYVTSRACQSSAPSLPSNGVAANLFVSNFPLQQDRTGPAPTLLVHCHHLFSSFHRITLAICRAPLSSTCINFSIPTHPQRE